MTPADLYDSVDVHMNAFSGYMNTSIGKRYAFRFLEWFQARNDCIALVAELAGTVVGYTVGAEIGYNKILYRDLFWTVAFGAFAHPFALIHKGAVRQIKIRMLSLFGLIAPPPNISPDLKSPVFSLVGMAVSDKAGKKGIGTMLAKAFEVEAKARGAKSIRLTVYSTNMRARALYFAQGYSVAEVTNAEYLYYYKNL